MGRVGTSLFSIPCGGKGVPVLQVLGGGATAFCILSFIPELERD